MWDYVFDFQQRLITQDNLTMNDICLLFYFSKKIINEDFLQNQNPSEYKEFIYSDIIKALPILKIEVKQLKNLIKKLYITKYINIQKIFAGVNVSLTFKFFNSLSKKQQLEVGNQKYFFLLKWKCISTLKNESGKIFPSFKDYYNNIITKYNYINIYNNNLNTEEDNSVNNNIVYGNLLPLFEKYPNFKTRYLKGLNIPSYFNCQKLIIAIDNSYYLREKATLKFIIENYDKAIRGDYKGESKESIVEDSKDVGIQQNVFNTIKTNTRDYSKGKDLLEDMP